MSFFHIIVIILFLSVPIVSIADTKLAWAMFLIAIAVLAISSEER